MISSVVPTKLPSTRAVNGAFEGSESLHAPATPRVWFGMRPKRFGRWLTDRDFRRRTNPRRALRRRGSGAPGGSRLNRPVGGGVVVVVVGAAVVVGAGVVVVGAGRWSSGLERSSSRRALRSP